MLWVLIRSRHFPTTYVFLDKQEKMSIFWTIKSWMDKWTLPLILLVRGQVIKFDDSITLH